MTDNKSTDYRRIEQAIDYIKINFKHQPSLDDIATAIGMSSFHFQRLFTKWAGVSPKKFIQFLSINYAKKLLEDENTSLLDTAHKTGLSGTSRLHDLFINIEGMTPGEYKNGGERLSINYSFSQSRFGKIITASTSKGICHIFFEEDEQRALHDLIKRFPNAQFFETTDKFQLNALRIFQNNWNQPDQIKLHLKATDFQLKVWEALLSIPTAKLSTYGGIAHKINKPKASRAVGTAIANNPIAFIIPCHRVIQSSGKLGGYMWGNTRKSAIIGWEASQVGANKNKT